MKDKKVKTKAAEAEAEAIDRVKVKVKIGKGRDKLHPKLKCRATRKVLDIWKRETEFVDGIFALLPATGEADEDLDEYLLDLTLKHPGIELHEASGPGSIVFKKGLGDAGLSDSEEKKKREKFLQRTKEILEEQKTLKAAEANDEAETTEFNGTNTKGKTYSHKPTREELLEKLHAKMALVAQHKNPNKKVKREKTEGKKERKKDAKKQFISKTNPNLKGTKSGSKSVKSEDSPTLTSYVEVQKSPIGSPAHKKSDGGQVVYSKFDFIAPPSQPKAKAKVTEVLKTVEKTEGKIARLEAMGKKSEAVEVSEGHKWTTALKRAEGQKVRDDPNLLKKTIKKEKKLKEVRKKKWAERIETVEKAKEMKVKKRQANIEGRREEKKKKQKKLQRKRGRIL